MKNLKKVLALVLVVATLMTMTTIASAKFTDVNSIEYKEAVDVLTAINVINGYTDGSFRPDGNVTRAQMAKMVAYIVAGGEDVGNLYAGANSFSDCTTHWAKGYIAYANKTGIVAGVGGGKFNPDGSVTGTQAAKMMLCALGYDAAAESYTGTNWSVNVLSDARDAGLLEGLEGVNMSAAMTREQAAQLMFNALKADMVKYERGNINIDSGDTNITIGGSAAEKVTNTKAKDYRVVTNDQDEVMQLAEKYFSDLKLDSKDTDNFGRPSSTWTYKKDDIGTYNNDQAVVIYTAETKAADVKADLKNYTYASGLKASVNTATGASVASYSDVAALTANGKTVEVYATDKVINDIIVIETGAAKVTAVNDTKKTFTISFNTNKTAVIDEDSEFYGLYGSVKKDDVLAISYNGSDVLDLYVPETTTGEITYVKSGNMEATVAGETVKAAATATNLFQGTLGQNSVVYLTKTGYAFYVDATTTSDAKYIYVTNMWEETDTSYGGGKNTLYVKGVLADGTIETLTIENPTTIGNFTDADYGMNNATVGTAAGNVVQFKNADTASQNKVYSYIENKSESGKYLLTVPAVAGATTEGVTVVTGSSSSGITTSTSKIGANYIASDVTFVYVSGNGDDVKATTGAKAAIANNISYTAVVEKDGNNYLATVVYVCSAATSSDDVIYISKSLGSVKYTNAAGDSKTGTKVEYYTASSDKVETMIVANGSTSSAGFYTLTADGDAYKTAAYTGNKKDNQAITSMYNGYATVGSEFNLKDALVVDVADAGINSVSALESAVNTEDQVVKVSFTYNAENEVETVYVLSAKSTDVAIDSVTVNGKVATVSGSTGGATVEVAKNAALTLAVNLSDSNASYTVKYDNNSGDGYSYGTFTNGVSTSADADSTTGVFEIIVTAEDGSTTATYYVAFTTPAAVVGG